jgi:uncharacterized membrane protein
LLKNATNATSATDPTLKPTANPTKFVPLLSDGGISIVLLVIAFVLFVIGATILLALFITLPVVLYFQSQTKYIFNPLLQMMSLNKALLSSFLLLILDGLWISLFLGPRFGDMISNIQGSPMSINHFGAIFSCIALILLITNFLPIVKTHFSAFLLGFVVYAVYDFTNLAVFQKYNPTIAMFDALWGGILFLTIYSVTQHFE